jgi:hypothetical protein
MSACLLRSVIRDFISSDKRIRRKRRKRKGGRGKKKRRRGRRRRRRRGGGGGGRRRRRRKETAQANISQPSRGDLCKEKSRLEFMMAGLLHAHAHAHAHANAGLYIFAVWITGVCGKIGNFGAAPSLTNSMCETFLKRGSSSRGLYSSRDFCI